MCMVPNDALELKEALECVLVEAQLLVAEPQVVERLHAGSVVLQGHVVQLLRLLHVALVEGAVAHVDEGGRVVAVGVLGQLGILLSLLALPLI